jgi:hypothetical protein
MGTVCKEKRQLIGRKSPAEAGLALGLSKRLAHSVGQEAVPGNAASGGLMDASSSLLKLDPRQKESPAEAGASA